MLFHNILSSKPEITSDVLNERIINLCSQTFIMPVGVEFELFLTTDDYVARPDLVSQYLYNTTKYTDVICKLNGISNPFELNSDMLLVCPLGEYVADFYLPAERDDVDDSTLVDTDSNKPIQKQVNDKSRSANDSIIGDRRFDINKENNTIVY